MGVSSGLALDRGVLTANVRQSWRTANGRLSAHHAITCCRSRPRRITSNDHHVIKRTSLVPPNDSDGFHGGVLDYCIRCGQASGRPGVLLAVELVGRFHVHGTLTGARRRGLCPLKNYGPLILSVSFVHKISLILWRKLTVLFPVFTLTSGTEVREQKLAQPNVH